MGFASFSMLLFHMQLNWNFCEYCVCSSQTICLLLTLTFLLVFRLILPVHCSWIYPERQISTLLFTRVCFEMFTTISRHAASGKKKENKKRKEKDKIKDCLPQPSLCSAQSTCSIKHFGPLTAVCPSAPSRPVSAGWYPSPLRHPARIRLCREREWKRLSEFLSKTL